MLFGAADSLLYVSAESRRPNVCEYTGAHSTRSHLINRVYLRLISDVIHL